MMQRITFLANINTFSGYGMASCEIIRGLVQAGYDVNVRAIAKSETFGASIPIEVSSRFVSRVQQEEWELLMHPPDFMPTPGKKTAFFTMWESSRLPEKSVEILKRASLIITPSHWNAACFSAAGIDVPIRVVPLGIDPDIFNYKPQRNGDRCVFGTAGRMAHGGTRKGMNEVVELFKKAFPKGIFNKVSLKVKGFSDCDLAVQDDPRIEITRAFLTDAQMANWLGSLTCFVSGAKGEGWGLLQHQAMACGRPVIATKYGGLAEFMDHSNSYPVRFRLNPADAYYKGAGVWAEPEDADMIAQMHRVCENPSEAIGRGFKGSQDVSRLTWKNCVTELVEVLKEFKILEA